LLFFFFFLLNPFFHLALAQSKTENSSPAPSSFTAEYPKDVAGVLVENSG
jgi:hypothetical protein